MGHALNLKKKPKRTAPQFRGSLEQKADFTL